MSMIDLPSPTDLVTNTLIWLGLPALLFVPITIALWIADWVRTLLQVGGGISHLGNAALKARRLPAVKIASLVLLQGFLAAIVYASFRLAIAMSITDSAGRNIADGKSFTWSELWIYLTTYSAKDQLPIQAFWIAVGWLAALNFAHLVRSRLLVGVLKAPVVPLVGLSALAAIGIGVIGLMVLALAEGFHDPSYNLGMVSLYAFWVMLLGGIAITLPAITSTAADVFRR